MVLLHIADKVTSNPWELVSLLITAGNGRRNFRYRLSKGATSKVLGADQLRGRPATIARTFQVHPFLLRSMM